MNHRTRPILFLLLVLLLLAGPAPAGAQGTVDRYRLGADLEVERLAADVWLHISYRDVDGWGRVRSNGLVVVSGGRALLVDTAWGDDPTERLLAWIVDTLGVALDRAVVTHGHDDRVGGLAALRRHGVPTYARTATADRAEAQGLPRPDSLFDDVQVLPVGARTVEAFFPGAAHTPDNVVVYLPDARLLFGGCMIRDAAARSMGNVAEADLAAWPGSVRRLVARYGDVQVVVPSHGPPGDRGLLDHTLFLLQEHARRPAGG